LPANLASSEAAYRIAPYLWTLQYTHLCPQNCFVLDDGQGRAVGYVIGCPDVFAFAEAYPRYVGEVLQSADGRRDVPAPEQLDTLEPWSVPVSGHGDEEKRVNDRCMAQLAYSVRWLLLEGVDGKSDLVRKYRATMHIDLLPEYQGQGWGRKLIESFVGSVRDSKLDYGQGIHIGVSGENTKVVPFYEKLGFEVYDGGEKEGNVWMIRHLGP
jgi:ribosomal protein S18 acetylase RimI-like enzyme